ncbi:hypothetical protein FA95DRAFT_1564592 [Auriscalpium vulgare]|uniref:Uncharacterized protein n=1 Tax=Auriscalpium vulgare TaxID=40419 RepID=A0ACB8RDL6_9AGAM|nr:hypothetical protein FA95DRAFT_1564592 [Auriscalpium vulgare]
MAPTQTPAEIQHTIVEWVYRSSQHDAIDYATLRACALVCRGWSPLAQRLLVRRVPCNMRNSHRDLPKLLRTLRANPHLAAHVRCINLVINAASRMGDSGLTLLELCPGVEAIFFGEIIDTVDSVLEARLRALPLRPVHLKLFGQNTAVNRIVNLWPNVRTLDLSVCAAGRWPPNLELCLPQSVQALRLHSLQNQCFPSHEADLPLLRDLDIRSPLWTDSQWCERLLASGMLPRVHNLTITGEFPPPNILEQLEQLKVLIFNTLPTQDVSLPTTLRHVGYHCEIRGQKQAHEATFLQIALGALEGLQLVTCARYSSAAQLAALEGACRGRGAEFKTYEDPRCIPTSWDVGWI